MAPRPEEESVSPAALSTFPLSRIIPASVLLPHPLTLPHALTSLGEKGSIKDVVPARSTMDLVDADDPWDFPELKDTGIKWSGETGRLVCWDSPA